MHFTRAVRRLIFKSNVTKCSRQVHYIQGQEPEPKVREYFYYIDHQGMVSLRALRKS